MEILPGIHSIPAGASAFMGISPPNVYLALGNEGAAFIDTGFNKPEDIKLRMDYLKTVGNPKVIGIILTHRHPDHMGGATRFQKTTGAPLISSPIEKKVIEAILERQNEKPQTYNSVNHGDALNLGDLTLEYVHGPGHTVGSMAIYAQEQKALFTGDTILGFGTTAINPDDGNMKQYLETLESFLRYDLNYILPGHGRMISNPQAKIKELAQHRIQRENQIIFALEEGPKSLEDLFRGIYSELDHRLHSQARSQIKSHLVKLETEGQVILQSDAYQISK